MTQPVDIRPGDLAIVQDILRDVLPRDAKVWVFGSRAKWTTKDSSDLDIAIDAGRALTRKESAALGDAFEDSDLPYKVDFVDMHAVGDNFKKIIVRDKVPLPKPDALREQQVTGSVDQWREVTLGEVYDFTSGLSKPRSEFGAGFPFLTFKDVFNNIFVPERLGGLVKSGQQERFRCSIKRGDVFLTRTSETMDELGMSCVALQSVPDGTFNGFTKRLRPKDGIEIIPEYAGYYFRSPVFRESVISITNMSTRASLNNEMLARLKITLPPPNEQKAIGLALRYLDDKIELNRRMNESLEAMARAIFKDWFVDFGPTRAKMEGRAAYLAPEIWALFPERLNDEGNPEGWELKPLSDLCTLGRGASPRPINDYMNGEVPWIKIADATSAGGPFLFETKEKVKAAGAEKSISVAPGDLILSNSATCGVPMFVELHGCIHDGWLYFKNLREVSKIYLYHILVELAEHLIQIADGSVQKNLNTALVGRQNLIVPPKAVVEAFDFHAGTWFGMMRQNSIDSRTLADTRDLLLPKLMSGEIRIKDAEKIAEAVA